MTVVPPGSLVLVTGANGFIAMWIIRLLLEKGYCVRGTVRSSDKIAHIKKTFKEYGDRIEIVVVEDIVKVCYSILSQIYDYRETDHLNVYTLGGRF